MNPLEALDILFKDLEVDLSAEGYLEANSKIRSNSPALANQIERALEPTLRKLFRRRNIPWQETSRGTAYRLVLLPYNPHFVKDTSSIRDALGVQEGRMIANPGEHLFESLAVWKDDLKFPIEVIAGRELAAQWIRQHKRAHKGLETDKLSPDLSPSLICESRRSAMLDLSKMDVPDWLRKEPQSGIKCDWASDTRYPLHRAVSRLLERHQLPHHICGNVEIYILTARAEDLTELNTLKIDVLRSPGKLPSPIMHQAMTIVVNGVDEFTTKEEWDRIWRCVIVPLQKRRLEERGHGPQGRRTPSIGRLLKATPVYSAWLKERSVEGALNKLQAEGAKGREIEPETARRVLRDLDILLRPKEDH